MLLNEGLSTLGISSEHRPMKGTKINGKDFKNMSPRRERKLKRVIKKLLLLNSVQIIQLAGIDGVKKVKRLIILHQLGSVKKTNQLF